MPILLHRFYSRSHVQPTLLENWTCVLNYLKVEKKTFKKQLYQIDNLLVYNPEYKEQSFGNEIYQIFGYHHDIRINCNCNT